MLLNNSNATCIFFTMGLIFVLNLCTDFCTYRRKKPSVCQKSLDIFEITASSHTLFLLSINSFLVLFNIILGAVSIEVCQPCLPGHYCAKPGASSPSGLCNPGFYCREGSQAASPLRNMTGSTSFMT